jgi:hypothetical protein
LAFEVVTLLLFCDKTNFTIWGMAEKSAKKQKTEQKEQEKAPSQSTSSDETKKKEDKPEETSVVEEEDISTPCWFYQDSNGLKQGPFSFKEMFLWWKGGYFANDLPVKTVWENEFTPLSTLPQFYNVPVKLAERIEKEQEELITKGQIEVPVFEPPKEDTAEDQYDEYTVVGGFNPLSGKFQKDDNAAYYGSKGLPADREQRMMSHYFDYQQYQLQMQAVGDKKKKKLVKGTKKFWKERKEKKKRAKLLAEYLAD